MHILISAVSGSRTPSGICRHAANLAIGLSSSREVERVTLVVGSWQAEYFRQSFSLGNPKLHVVSIEISPSSFARNRWHLAELPKVIARHSPDVVHLSYPVPFLKAHIDPVVVSTIHDLYPYDLPANFGHFRAYFNRWLLKVCIKGSDHLTCVSNATQNRLMQIFPSLPSAKVSRIYNIVDSAFCSATTRSTTPFTTRPYVLAVAQHRQNKRLDLLLLAFSQLLSSGDLHLSTLLILVGNSGPETARLNKLVARLHLESSVQMVHGLPDSEMAWLYAHCLLLACPSACEGFNLPLAEAITAGTRVVCSDIPVHREIGGDACEYFNPLSPGVLQGFLKALRRSLRKEAPDRLHMNMFSSESVIPQYARLYHWLLSRAASKIHEGESHRSDHESRAS